MWIDIWKKVVNIFLHATLNGSRALRLFLGLWPCAEAIATLFGQLCLEARKNRMQDKQANSNLQTWVHKNYCTLLQLFSCHTQNGKDIQLAFGMQHLKNKTETRE